MAAADPHQSGGGPSMWAPLFGSTAAAEPTTVRAGVSRRPEQPGLPSVNRARGLPAGSGGGEWMGEEEQDRMS